MIGWTIFVAGNCMGAVLTCCAVLARGRVGARQVPACPFEDVPPPPTLKIVKGGRPFDWQRDGAA